MAGRVRTRGTRTACKVRCLYSYLLYGFQRNDLTEATRMAGGARTRGMRTACKVWCLYSYLLYGFQRNDLTEATRMAGGRGEDKRDEYI
jgi:hypothetical protein